MKLSLKPLMLTALVALPLMGVAQAQNWRQDVREDLRINRQEYREAVRNQDRARANDEARQIRANERQLNQCNYYLRNNNSGWNNGYYYRTTPYNNGWYNRVNTYPYNRTYP